MTAAVAAAIADVKRALAKHPPRPPQQRAIIGRWALRSGAVFAVYRINGALALCGNGAERWHVPVSDVVGLLDRGQLRYLGRIR